MRSSDHPPSISIGALSKLSGVPSDTIRTWERRYQVLSPKRDENGRRVYTIEDSRRLKLIGELTRLGERVAKLAQLDLAQLKTRRELHHPAQTAIEPGIIRVGVLHPTLREQLTGPISSTKSSIQTVGHATSMERFDFTVEADVILLDIECLGPHPDKVIDMIQTHRHPGTLVLTYYFLPRSLSEFFKEKNVLLVKSPVSRDALQRIIYDNIGQLKSATHSPQSEPKPDPARFDRKLLEQIMNETARIECECPMHISALVLALREFEIYSWSCMSKNEEDLEIHHKLAKTTGQARSLMEDMLEIVCAHDGIQI